MSRLGDDWRTRRACDERNAEIWFPAGEESGDGTAYLAAVDRAKAICRSCPVLSPCADWALRVGLEWGVVGGLSRHDRTALTEAVITPAPIGGGLLNAEKTECKNGHEYTPSSTIWDRNGHRKCRTCARNVWRINSANHRARRRVSA